MATYFVQNIGDVTCDTAIAITANNLNYAKRKATTYIEAWFDLLLFNSEGEPICRRRWLKNITGERKHGPWEDC